MERSSTSIAIREMQIKSTMRQNLISTRMSRQEQVGKDVQELEPSYTAGVHVKWCSRFGKQPAVPQKLELTYDPGILLLVMYPKEIKT